MLVYTYFLITKKKSLIEKRHGKCHFRWLHLSDFLFFSHILTVPAKGGSSNKSREIRDNLIKLLLVFKSHNFVKIIKKIEMQLSRRGELVRFQFQRDFSRLIVPYNEPLSVFGVILGQPEVRSSPPCVSSRFFLQF